MNEKIGFEVVLRQEFDQAIEMVTEALKGQGFGILTRIDIKETYKNKLNVDFRPYVILGACNPPLSYKALSSDSKVGLFLPCNVTVEAAEKGGSIVRFVNPAMMVHYIDNPDQPELKAAAAAGLEKIKQVIATLEQAA